jgi:hypothetical protein
MHQYDATADDPGRADALMAFGSETDPRTQPISPSAPGEPRAVGTRARRRAWPATALRPRTAAVVAMVCAAGLLVVYATTRRAASAPEPEPQGTVAITSRPSGSTVKIDGVARGRTPATLTVAAGAHTLELSAAGASRTIPFDVERGAKVFQYVELETPVASRPATSAASPERPAATTGNTIPPVPDPATRTTTEETTGGWVSLSAPFELQIAESGHLIGTTAADRIMLPTGWHTLELSNDRFGYRNAVRVQIAAGKVASTRVAVPNGTLSVNALPWADVLVDGRPVGTTPLGGIALPIGSHQVTLRHPQYGERSQDVIVTAATPARVGVDLRN